MADPAYRIELTATFLERPESIEASRAEADAPHAYDALLAALRGIVDDVLPDLYVRGNSAMSGERQGPAVSIGRK